MRPDRGHVIRNTVGLVFYLAGGWRSYNDIGKEFGWKCWHGDGTCKTARRNVQALEEAGLPIERSKQYQEAIRVRLPPDWVARTSWLRRYIIRKEPLAAPAYTRSLHK